MEKKIPLIFDCDNTMGVPGCDVDDGLTLLYLLGLPEVELLGVTCSYGNNTQETVYRNTLRLLKDWGRTDIPVFRGADSAADRSSDAAKFLAKMSRRYEGALRVIATGAMTNLLGAEEGDNGFFRRVKEFSIMGGITEPLLVGGRPMDELNLSCDPTASLEVLRKGGRVQIATAQNALRSYFPKEDCLRSLRTRGGALGAYLEEHIAYWFDVYETNWALSGFVNWDVMAAVQMLHPEFVVPMETEISPTEESLRKGMLYGEGDSVTLLLPVIEEQEAYFRHIEETWFSARVTLAGEDE